MSVLILKMMLALGIAGHAINMYCDRTLSVFPKGKITLSTMKDADMGEKLAELLDGVSEKIPMRAAILGAFALMMEEFGYLAISAYVYGQAPVYGMVLAAMTLVYIVIGTAHHVRYGLVEWIYIRMGGGPKAKDVMMDMYNSAQVTKVVYGAYLVFIVTLIVATFTGAAGLPVWMAVFTVLPVFIVLVPFRILGTLHIAAMVTMLAWLIVI